MRQLEQEGANTGLSATWISRLLKNDIPSVLQLATRKRRFRVAPWIKRLARLIHAGTSLCRIQAVRGMKNQLVICVANKGYDASLEKRKRYEKIPDEAASGHGQVRVIDESGEAFDPA